MHPNILENCEINNHIFYYFTNDFTILWHRVILQNCAKISASCLHFVLSVRSYRHCINVMKQSKNYLNYLLCLPNTLPKLINSNNIFPLRGRALCNSSYYTSMNKLLYNEQPTNNVILHSYPQGWVAKYSVQNSGLNYVSKRAFVSNTSKSIKNNKLFFAKISVDNTHIYWLGLGIGLMLLLIKKNIACEKKSYEDLSEEFEEQIIAVRNHNDKTYDIVMRTYEEKKRTDNKLVIIKANNKMREFIQNTFLNTFDIDAMDERSVISTMKLEQKGYRMDHEGSYIFKNVNN